MAKSNGSVYDKISVYAAAVVLIVLALVFYKERVLFSDSAAYIVHIISRNHFELSLHSRFVGILSQILPLTALRWHASLRCILLLYSLNSILIPVTCALLSLHWFKESRTAWSIFLFYTLMSTWLFYYPVSEYQMGLCLLLFYNGAYNYYSSAGRSGTPAFLALSLLLIPVVIFSHPLAMPVFISWLLLKKITDKYTWRQLLFPFVPALLSYLVKRLCFPVTYETDKAKGLDNFRNFSTHDLFSELGMDFVRYILHDYFLLPVLAVAVLLLLLKRKNYSGMAAFLLVLTGWWVLVTTAFSSNHYDHYYEHMYQAIPFFISLYCCHILIPALRPYAGRLTLLLVFILSLFKINQGRQFFEDRFAWFRRGFQLMETQHCKKMAIICYVVPGGATCPSYWSVPYETLLLSSLDARRSGKSIFIAGRREEAQDAVNVVYDIDPIDDFPLVPERYFDIKGYPYCHPPFSEEQLSDILHGKYSSPY